MTVNLNQVFDVAGESIHIDYSFDPLKICDYIVFASPVKVTGSITNKAQIVTAALKVEFIAKLICDRCLKTFARKFSFNFKHNLILQLNTDNDDYIVVRDAQLDLDNLVVNDIVLDLPIKTLCVADCKGLCAGCGADLNEKTCICSRNVTDR